MLSTLARSIVIWLSLVSCFGLSVSVPAASWITNGSLANPRYGHTATLLPNGNVLVAGGRGPLAFYSSAELYHLDTGLWTSAGSMSTNRSDATATLLPNGKVLVAGGFAQVGFDIPTYSSVELFDPTTSAWTNSGPMQVARAGHTATLLPNGRVLVVGGYVAGFVNPTAVLDSAEIYDPSNGNWTVTSPLLQPRRFHTATLLPGGKVLVVGGQDTNFNYLASAEVYDVSSANWTPAGSLLNSRALHTATLLPTGKVLVAGGQRNTNLASAELFDPATGNWSGTMRMNTPRSQHSASLLPDGKVLVAGGYSFFSVSNAEIYDPANATWTLTTTSMSIDRAAHTATILPNGKVLVTGGSRSEGFDTVPVAGSEVYDSSESTWATNPPMTFARYLHSATLLPNGEVLVSGGMGTNLNVATAELYDPTARSWTNTGTMPLARSQHTATLLPNGKVLVAGGRVFGVTYTNGEDISEELFDPAAGAWSLTGALKVARTGHTATLLPNGKVLVAGGSPFLSSITNGCEIYDPGTASWTMATSMNYPRSGHTATLLLNGKVLITGGVTNGGVANTVELYDPVSGTWSSLTPLNHARFAHTATPLLNGKVLVAGGVDNTSQATAEVEIFDPVSGSWTPTDAMLTPRLHHTAILLPSGMVLVAGGVDSNNHPLTTVELYDPATAHWTAGSPLNEPESGHSMTLLPNGEVLLAGGSNGTNAIAHTQLYDIGLGFSNSWQAVVTNHPSINSGEQLVLSGLRFRGISEATTGNSQASSTDFPMVQLRGMDGAGPLFISPANWSDNSFVSQPVSGYPAGWALATVFVNGIPSLSTVLLINPLSPPSIILRDESVLPDGSFQFSFTNMSGSSFTALASTNASLPTSNWLSLGTVPEIAPGQFHFIDAGAPNFPRRFYRVRTDGVGP